ILIHEICDVPDGGISESDNRVFDGNDAVLWRVERAVWGQSSLPRAYIFHDKGIGVDLFRNVDPLHCPTFPIRSAYEVWLEIPAAGGDCKHNHFVDCNPVEVLGHASREGPLYIFRGHRGCERVEHFAATQPSL